MVEHQFGGAWTEEKLRCLSDYLRAYAIALRKQSFHKMYIDAFAGTGTRKSPAKEAPATPLLPEVGKLAKGSAQIALEIDPPFDEYLFVEQDQRFCAELDRLAARNPLLQSRTRIVNADANDAVGQVC